MENEKIKFYSYVVACDNGFAPNPYGRECTLACCKPDIRRKAKRDNWIIGIGSLKHPDNKKGDRIVYIMIVDESMPWEDYSKKYPERTDNNYVCSERRPSKEIEYYKIGRKYWYVRNKKRGEKYGHYSKKHIKKDIELGENVLISRRFIYFGDCSKIKKKVKYLSDFELSSLNLKPGHPRRKHRVFEVGKNSEISKDKFKNNKIYFKDKKIYFKDEKIYFKNVGRYFTKKDLGKPLDLKNEC